MFLGIRHITSMPYLDVTQWPGVGHREGKTVKAQKAGHTLPSIGQCVTSFTG